MSAPTPGPRRESMSPWDIVQMSPGALSTDARKEFAQEAVADLFFSCRFGGQAGRHLSSEAALVFVVPPLSGEGVSFAEV